MNLNLCNNNHDEIVYSFPGFTLHGVTIQTKGCPVCEREIEIYDLKAELAIKMSLLAEYKALIDKHLEQTIKEGE